MKKQSIIFLGSKEIGYKCFEYLIAQKDKLDFDIKGLLTNENNTFQAKNSLIELAKKHDISIYNSLNEIDEVDYIYSVQYHKILKQNEIEKAKILAINLHMAPLPEYRGCNQFSFAILDNQTEFGTTIHRIDSKIDHGEILFERRFSIPENCWVQDLYEITFNESILLFQETLQNILQQNFISTPQSSFEKNRKTHLHFRNEIKEIKEINLNWDKEKIERHIRATSMPGFEPPFAILNNKKIYFSETWQ